MDITLGDRIILLRKRAKLSQTQISFRLTVPDSKIEDWEQDRGTPSLTEATILADMLNCSIDFLVGRSKHDIDFDLLKRTETIQNMTSPKHKEIVIKTMDVFIRDYLRFKANGINFLEQDHTS